MSMFDTVTQVGSNSTELVSNIISILKIICILLIMESFFENLQYAYL